MNDPYKTLGISKTASADEIKKSYRKLAKQHHPDLNQGNAQSASRFKDISSAYDLLSDVDKRARFDRGEIDASGQERADAFYRSQGAGRQKAGRGFDPSDIFADMFARGGQAGGGGFGRSDQEFKMRGGDQSYTLTVDFLEAAKGAQKRLSFPDGRALDVNVPVGAETGTVLRLRNQGQPGSGGGPAGDALIEITVEPHVMFKREGNNVVIELPVTLSEAVAGGKINVPTIDGPVSMTVPAGSNSGTRMRLRGRGIAPKGATAGDQYITLKVMLPKEPDAELSDFIKAWSGRNYEVRNA